MDPKYMQIANTIRDEVLSGRYPRGTRLPILDDLNERFDCSNGATLPALAVLVKEGLVTKKHGLGTFSNYGPEYMPVAEQLHALRDELSQISRSVEGALAKVNAVIEDYAAAQMPQG